MPLVLLCCCAAVLLLLLLYEISFVWFVDFSQIFTYESWLVSSFGPRHGQTGDLCNCPCKVRQFFNSVVRSCSGFCQLRVRSEMLARSRNDVVVWTESGCKEDVTKSSADPREWSGYIRLWSSCKVSGDRMQDQESELLQDLNLGIEDIWILTIKVVGDWWTQGS